MITINRNATNHNFEKQNLITQFDRHGQYDIYKCQACGLSGKARDLVSVSVANRKKALNCQKTLPAKRIRITKCNAFGKIFENLVEGSVHEILATPLGQSNSCGVWVMGVGEPAKVLFGEYILVE